MINFNCPHCNAIIETDDIYAGQKDFCPQCGKEIIVPKAKAVQKAQTKHETNMAKLPRLQWLSSTTIQNGEFLVLLFIALVVFIKATERTRYTYTNKTVAIEYSEKPGEYNSFTGLTLALDEEYRHYEIVSATPIVDTYQKNYGNSEYVTGLRPITQTTKVVFILRKKTTFRFYHLGYWRTER